MEVKRGYKQTEVGVIPEEWQVGRLGEIAALERGKFTARPRNQPRFFGGEIPFIQTGDVTNSNGNISTYTQTLNAEGLRVSKLFPRDTLFFTIAANIGDVGIAAFETAATDSLIAISPKPRIDKRWLFHTLKKRKNEFEILATHNAQLNISLEKLRPYPLAVPPRPEQEAIAEALSDADALTESLEQLVVKKRHLKQGAMQELVTGKKPLPGFSGEWEMKRLDELGRWTGGMTPSMRNPDYWHSGTVPWISSGDVKSVRLTSTAFSISEYAIKQRATTFLPAKSIIVVTRSGILRKYLPVAMNMIPMAINQDIKALLPNEHVLPEYLLHSLTCNGERILGRCLKSGTTVESIEFPWLKAFTIPVPPLPEQTAIAAILSDMDAEIAAMETKLAKARNIKQGMMQELLTGRIRLI